MTDDEAYANPGAGRQIGPDTPLPDADHAEELTRLRQPPTGGKPVPPARTSLQELPFGELHWSDFEKLCERLASLEGEPERVARYGVGGQDQAGIDVYARLPGGGGYVVYQCKHHATIYASTIRNAVDEFLENQWSQSSGRFVFCTAHTLVPTSLADEIETQAKKLGNHEPPIVLETWGLKKLYAEAQITSRSRRRLLRIRISRAFSPGGSGRTVDVAAVEATAHIAAMVQGLVDSANHEWSSRRSRGRRKP